MEGAGTHEHGGEPARGGETPAAPPIVAPAAPPVVRPSARPSSKRASWPQPIGIIAIVIGALSALVGLSAIVSMSVSGVVASTPAPGNAAATAAMRDMMWTNGIIGMVKAATASALIVGGVLVLKRRVWGVRAVLAWSVVRMGIGAWSAVAMIGVQRGMMSAAAPTGPGAPPAGLFAGMAVFMGLFTLLWEWAAPVFFLIWFARPGVRAETRRWNAPAPQERV